MSRIGRLPVTVPDGVEVTVDGQLVTVLGPEAHWSIVSLSRSRSRAVRTARCRLLGPTTSGSASRCTA